MQDTILDRVEEKTETRSDYIKPTAVLHSLEDIVRAGGNSGSDFLGTPNSQF